MCTPTYNNDQLVSIEEGIDLEIFSYLKLSRLINANLASFMSGRIFITNLAQEWREGLVDSGSYAIQIGQDSYGGLSRRCSLDFPIENKGFIYGVGNRDGGNRVRTSSVLNMSDIDEVTYTDKYINFI
jgi:hypothetical protein